MGLASINPLTLVAQLFPGNILASRALSLCPEVKDDDVLRWGEGTRGTRAKIHVPLDPELPLYVGGLVFLWEVGERKGSFPVPSNYA